MPDEWTVSPGEVVPKPVPGGRRRSPKRDVVLAGLDAGHPLSREFDDITKAREYVKELRRLARDYGAKLHAGYRAEAGKTVAVIEFYREEK